MPKKSIADWLRLDSANRMLKMISGGSMRCKIASSSSLLVQFVVCT
jgi:hypothetical protein